MPDFLRTKLFAFLVFAALTALAVHQVFIVGQDNADRFTTLCQVQEGFLQDVIETRQESADKPGISEAQRQVDLDAVVRYQDRLAELHSEFGRDCAL